ncbi:MAG TPA: tetratricopeptide repeat protein, partial [Pyrinomonadaceae bacterium]|nr:tetratricopeptide repeat protein [Pyrinomonadaceae bacterium]
LEEANTLYRSAEDLIRNTTGDLHRLALLWAEHGEKLDEALAVAAGDYETNKDIYAADILAWCLYKNGRYAEAKEKIGEALRLNTGDARILYHAGMIEKALGNSKTARNLLRSALTANPYFDMRGASELRLALQALK